MSLKEGHSDISRGVSSTISVMVEQRYDHFNRANRNQASCYVLA